jgi:hypothetical protein
VPIETSVYPTDIDADLPTAAQLKSLDAVNGNPRNNLLGDGTTDLAKWMQGVKERIKNMQTQVGKTGSTVSGTIIKRLTDTENSLATTTGTLSAFMAQKAAASGLADLDSTTKVPVARLGTGSADGTKFLRGDRIWAVPAGGGGGSAVLPGVKLMNDSSFVGVDDDDTFQNLRDYAQLQTYRPTILFDENRNYDLFDSGIEPYNGMALAGVGSMYGEHWNAADIGDNANNKQARNHNINLRHSAAAGVGWFNLVSSSVWYEEMSMSDMCFRCTINPGGAVMTQNTGTIKGTHLLLMHNITAFNMWSIIGTNGGGAPSRPLTQTCTKFSGGGWHINSCRSTAFHIAGSDMVLWSNGMLLDADPLWHPAGNGLPHIFLNFADKCQIIGQLYITCQSKWFGILMDGIDLNDGSNSNVAQVSIMGAMIGGQSPTNPTYGYAIRMDGGSLQIIGGWVGFAMSDPATAGHGDLGVIDVRSGRLDVFGVAYDHVQASLLSPATVANAESIPFISAKGDTATHEGAIAHARLVQPLPAGDPWVGKPVMKFTGGATGTRDSTLISPDLSVPLESASRYTATFRLTGTLTTGAKPFKNEIYGDWKIVKVCINVGTGPTGADLIIDINKNGTSIWATTPANRAKILAGTGTTGESVAFDTKTVTTNDILSFDIDQIGSTIAGADISVDVWLEQI